MFPVCSSCTTRKDKCEWPRKKTPGSESKVLKTKTSTKKIASLSEPPREQISPSSFEHLLNYLDDEGVEEEVNLPDSHELSLVLLAHDGLDHEMRYDMFFDLPEINIGFPYLQKIDTAGVLYLEFYREKYCEFITIGTDSLNYFLKTFLSLAATNESILYALTAWGGFYLELSKPKSDFAKPWAYMQKAAKLMCAQIGDNLAPRNKDEFFELFAFYLIFIGIEVCTGDVCNWGGFLQQCSALIKEFGGLKKVCEAFGHCNDIKWLLSDFQFHDLLSLNALMKGTQFKIEEYEEVLPEDSNYGIDPLQGTIGPIYNLLGEIGNARVELRHAWAKIDISNIQQRLDYYENVGVLYQNFRTKIDQCKPLESHILILELDAEEMDLQMSLFDLYNGICCIQLESLIYQIPPWSNVVQRYLMKCLQLIDKLLNTRVRVALSMLLLVCGMACVTTEDRNEMRQRFEALLVGYDVGNLPRIKETVEETWVRNPLGNTVIDWAELVQEKGWNLYVG